MSISCMPGVPGYSLHIVSCNVTFTRMLLSISFLGIKSLSLIGIGYLLKVVKPQLGEVLSTRDKRENKTGPPLTFHPWCIAERLT